MLGDDCLFYSTGLCRSLKFLGGKDMHFISIYLTFCLLFVECELSIFVLEKSETQKIEHEKN